MEINLTYLINQQLDLPIQTILGVMFMVIHYVNSTKTYVVLAMFPVIHQCVLCDHWTPVPAQIVWIPMSSHL